MYVSARRSFWRVDVSVCVDPDESDALILPAIIFCGSRNCAGRHRMVPPEGKRNFSGVERLDDQLSSLATGCGNFFQILGASVALFFLLRNRDCNVATIFHLMA